MTEPHRLGIRIIPRRRFGLWRGSDRQGRWVAALNLFVLSCNIANLGWHHSSWLAVGFWVSLIVLNGIMAPMSLYAGCRRTADRRADGIDRQRENWKWN